MADLSAFLTQKIPSKKRVFGNYLWYSCVEILVTTFSSYLNLTGIRKKHGSFPEGGNLKALLIGVGPLETKKTPG
jgi:hypothetical protein